jgi:hypothetical protein
LTSGADNHSKESRARSSFAVILEALLGYIPVIVILVYPVGVIALYLQLYEYTGTHSSALSAASVVSPVVTVGNVLPFFLLAAIASIISFAIALAALIFVRAMPYEGRVKRLVAYFAVLLSSLIVYMMLLFLLVVIVTQIGEPLDIYITVTSGRDWTNVSVFLVLVGVGGAIGALLAGPKLFSLTANQARMIFRFRPIWRGLAAAYLGAIIGAIFFAGVHNPTLPTVDLEWEQGEGALLLAHSNGYWYVITAGDQSFYAVPDDRAGDVYIYTY